MGANNNRHPKSEAVKELERLQFENLIGQHPNFPCLKKPVYNDNTSNGLTKCVIDYIQLRGFQAERINSMGMQIDNRNTSTDILGNSRIIGSRKWIKSSGRTGTADISATIQGRSVKIEIKCEATGDKYQSEAQRLYQRQIENAGGVYLIVRTFNDFYNWFNRKKLSL